MSRPSAAGPGQRSAHCAIADAVRLMPRSGTASSHFRTIALLPGRLTLLSQQIVFVPAFLVAAEVDADIDVFALVTLSWALLSHPRTSGHQVATKHGFRQLRVIAVVAPRFEGGMEHVDINLPFGV